MERDPLVDRSDGERAAVPGAAAPQEIREAGCGDLSPDEEQENRVMRAQTLTAFVLYAAVVGGAAVQASTPDTTFPHGTFQQVGNLTTPRFNPTATLLNDGTVW
jgi:hypothetical protein